VNGNRTVVGVVGDIYQSSLERDPMREAYVPVGQGTVFQGELVIKTSGDPYAVLPAVRSAVFAVLPDVPLRSVRTLEEVFARQRSRVRLHIAARRSRISPRASSSTVESRRRRPRPRNCAPMPSVSSRSHAKGASIPAVLRPAKFRIV
jgi:hypothetical protein